MEQRLDLAKTAPGVMTTMRKLTAHVHEGPIEQRLLELVMVRASQINGCAFCIHMHTRDARAHGESEERLYLLSAWWESSLFTPREKAALIWTDSLTLIAQTRAPDADYATMREHFDEAEAVKLTMLIGAINVWNRLAVGFRSQHPRKWVAEKAA